MTLQFNRVYTRLGKKKKNAVLEIKEDLQMLNAFNLKLRF